jgi:hypothetical protein
VIRDSDHGLKLLFLVAGPIYRITALTYIFKLIVQQQHPLVHEHEHYQQQQQKSSCKYAWEGWFLFIASDLFSLFLRHGDRSGWGRHLLGSVFFAGIWWGFVVSPLYHIPQVVMVLWGVLSASGLVLWFCVVSVVLLCKIHNNYM